MKRILPGGGLWAEFDVVAARGSMLGADLAASKEAAVTSIRRAATDLIVPEIFSCGEVWFTLEV